MRDARAIWPVEQGWRFHLIFAPAWKQPRLDLLALFRALDRMDYPPLRFRSGLFSSCSNSMPIMRKRCGRWINNPELRICGPCSVTLWLHWTNCRKLALDSEKIFPEGLIRAWPG